MPYTYIGTTLNPNPQPGAQTMSEKQILMLDFDNVVTLDPKTGIGSEEIKRNAWLDVFSDVKLDPLKHALVTAHERIRGGGDRKDIARFILKELRMCNEKLEDEVTSRCKTFEDRAQVGIRMMTIPKNTRKALAQLSKHTRLYLNTATPTEAVKISLRALDLEKYFLGVFGRPASKIHNIRLVAEREGLNPESTKMMHDRVVFVDDQAAGLDTAHKIGCRFVAMRTRNNSDWLKNATFPVINSLDELWPLLSFFRPDQ